MAAYKVTRNEKGLYDLASENINATDLLMPQVWAILAALEENLEVEE